MSDTVLNYNLQQTLTETLSEAEQPAASSAAERRRVISGMNRDGQLDSTTTPAIEKPPGYQKITLGGSPTTLDLTAMPAARDPSVSLDFTGKKLIGLRLAAPAANVAAITVAPGSSNPYPLFGSGNSIEVKPGERVEKVVLGVASAYPAVAAGVKTIDVSGTSADVLEILPLFGT